jgi:lysophospholipase L1-like esterase
VQFFGAFAIAKCSGPVLEGDPVLLCLSSARPARRHGAALAVAIVVALGATACEMPAVKPAPSRTAGLQPNPSARPAAVVPGQSFGGRPRIMIVGDSVTEGSSGDFTWQYRLYEHLLTDGVRPHMVGPYHWLYNNVTHAKKAYSYANPDFERANDAQWGLALFREKTAIGRKVATYRPDYLLVLLGLNDLFWYGLSQPVMANNLASFIATARAARPRIRIVLGLIPPDIHERKAAFAASVASYNRTISSTAARLSTTKSPIAVASDGSGISVAADLWDGTHPNANGEIKIAAGFADILASRFHLGQLYPKPYPVLPTGPLIHPRLTVRPASTARGAVLTWTLAPGADSYVIYIKDMTRQDAGFTRLPYPLPVSKDPWTAGLLNSGNTYTFRVQACKGSDCGAFSNPASVTAP